MRAPFITYMSCLLVNGISFPLTRALHRDPNHCVYAVPKDLQLARRIRGPLAGVSSY